MTFVMCCAARPPGAVRSGLAGSNQSLEQLERWSDPDAVRPLIILRAGGGDLPGGGLRKTFVQVAQATVRVGIRPLAFDQMQRPSRFGYDEIDFTARIFGAPKGARRNMA